MYGPDSAFHNKVKEKKQSHISNAPPLIYNATYNDTEYAMTLNNKLKKRITYKKSSDKKFNAYMHIILFLVCRKLLNSITQIPSENRKQNFFFLLI